MQNTAQARRRILGRTGLSISEIAFGCGPTAALMISGSVEQRRLVVERALSLGINYFDTAPGYGNSLSESNLGQTLHELGSRPVIATKVALEMSDLHDIAGAVERSVEASLARLRVPRVDVIQLHNRVGGERAARAEFGSGALLTERDILDAGGVAEGFRRVRDRGLVKFFGCSAFGGDMECVKRLVDSDTFDVIMVHCSLFNPTALAPVESATIRNYQQVAVRAVRRGMGVIALRVLEGGPLAGPVDAAPKGMNESEYVAVGKLASSIQAAFRPRMTPSEAATRFVLSNDSISTALIGFSDTQQVDEAIGWSDRGVLDATELDQLISLGSTARMM